MYAPKDKPEPLIPVRLDLDSSFTFSCEKEMACFTKCCKDVNIMLTPYDIIQMKHALGLASDEFLFLYSAPSIIEGTELPVPVLKTDSQAKTCAFLLDSGCSIYNTRPLACRYYPLGAGIFHNSDAFSEERFFALISEPHCLGHSLGKERVVRDWLKDQGIEQYEKANAGWVELILKRKSLGPFVNIPEKTLQMFFMACYNIDSFRRFVFESRFLDVYVVPDERQREIAGNDLALLELGMEWLKTTLLGGGEIGIRQHISEVVD